MAVLMRAQQTRDVGGYRKCTRKDLVNPAVRLLQGDQVSEQTTIEFQPFPKIARWSRDIVVSEKIDGTNAGIFISDDLETMKVASRTRWIVPGDDNHGFATWAYEFRDELRELGPGMHWGEWYGKGIQRNYGLTEKRFALFNVARWTEARPACCHVVPTLYRGPMDEQAIFDALTSLANNGSVAAPGFMNPEGIVIWHNAAQQLFKKTLTRDEEPKGMRK